MAQPNPYNRPITPQPHCNQPFLQNAAKPQVTVHESVEQKRPTRDRTSSRKKCYVPTALRTGSLLAFCILTLVVFACLQAASVAYVKAHGFDSLDTDFSSKKRSADPQASDSSCPPGATCAPAAGSWSNPDSVSPSSDTAPGPGSFTSAASIYFLGAYVPTLLAIVLGIWWKCVFARLKEMEPYYQLARKIGAQPKDSLFLSYLPDALPSVFFKSLRSRHWLTFIGAVNMALLIFFTLLAAETLHMVGVGDGCGVVVDAQGSSNDDCEMELVVKPALGFLLGGVLLAVLFSVVLLLVRLRRHSSGLVSEATSIAGIASLSTPALSRESPHTLRNSSRRFALVFSEGGATTTIVETTPLAQEPMLQLSHSLQPSVSGTIKKSHWEMNPIILTLFLIYQSAILAIILYYRYVSKPGTDDPIEDFMDSESFGIRLFMTGLGLGTKFYWGWVEKYVRSLSPYIAMAIPNGAPAQKSVLMETHSHPVTAIFSGSTWRHGIPGPVTLMAALSEILVVTLNTVPFTDTTAYTAFQVSVWFCVIILGLMIVTVPAVILWVVKIKRKSVADVPECIEDVLWLAGDTELWRGLNGMSEKERAEAVQRWDAKFATRQVQGRWQIVPVR
ncbi:hypothetical protein OPT61_g888 [Boeremia exigua]|uniref:Uncharacterized protein n=1 Tax=Boeremia exigua TaxID=749465 RepID=A0ACC2IS67_9PLEO|nr:hypothetical protein OPT61_g888 [Boeremia exigua]